MEDLKMKITLEFLNKFNACDGGIKFVEEKGLIRMETVDFIEKLIEFDKLPWANWLTVRVLDKIDRVKYAVFAAEQVIDIFEKEYPDDDAPSKAIDAAKAYIDNPSYAAAEDAYAAAHAVCTCHAVSYAAAHAAYTAGYDAPYVDAAYAIHAAYIAAHAAARATDDKMFKKIIKNGIQLLKEALK